MSLRLKARAYCNVTPCSASCDVEIEVLGISVENVPGYARLYQDSRVVWPEGWSGEDGSAVAFCPEHRGKGVL